MATTTYPISYQSKVEARLDPQVKSDKTFGIHLHFTNPAYSSQVHLTISFDDYAAQREYYKKFKDKGVLFVCSIKTKEVIIPEMQYVGDNGVAIGVVTDASLQSQVIVKYCYNNKREFEPLPL